MRQLGEAYDFMVEEIPAEESDHVKVSSTKVREALLKGHVEVANEQLGYVYPMTGVVVKGDQLGRTLGVPTANIALVDTNKQVPGDGVYAVSVTLRNETFKGMLNIGVRPTVSDKGERSMEVNLFDFDRDIYSELVTVHLHGRIRDEMKFENVETLKAWMHKDRDAALQILNKG